MGTIAIKIIQRNSGRLPAQDFLKLIGQPAFARATAAENGHKQKRSFRSHAQTGDGVSHATSSNILSSLPRYCLNEYFSRTNSRPCPPNCRASVLSRNNCPTRAAKIARSIQGTRKPLYPSSSHSLMPPRQRRPREGAVAWLPIPPRQKVPARRNSSQPGSRRDKIPGVDLEETKPSRKMPPVDNLESGRHF